MDTTAGNLACDDLTGCADPDIEGTDQPASDSRPPSWEAAAAKLTWSDLIKREPRLEVLRLRARSTKPHRRGRDPFCRRGEMSNHYRPRIKRLVGWTCDSDDPLMQTNAAYLTACNTIFGELPPCWKTGCTVPWHW